MTLRLGDRGADVGAVQQLLLESGETIDQQELAQAFFGPSTKTATLDFQSSHVDTTGHPLAADGEVGPKTRLALADPRAPHEVYIANGWRGSIPDGATIEEQMVVAAAISEIGVKEDPPGSNRGPRVDEFNGEEWIGAPWCANFASFCWAHAPSGSPFGKRASALKLKDWATSRNCLLPSSERAMPGDLGLILRAGGRGHVAIVVAKEDFGEPLMSVEGNNGNAVRATVRPRAAFSHIMRPRRIG